MMAHTGLPESLPIGDAEPHGFEESIPDWVSMSSDDLDVTDPEPAGLDKRINQLRRSILAMKSKTVKLQWRLDHLCRVRSRLRERQRVSDGTATLKRHSRTKGIHESVSVAESSTVIEIQVLPPHAKSPVAVSCIVGDSSVEGRLLGEPVSAQNDSEAVGISVQIPSLEEVPSAMRIQNIMGHLKADRISLDRYRILDVLLRGFSNNDDLSGVVSRMRVLDLSNVAPKYERPSRL